MPRHVLGVEYHPNTRRPRGLQPPLYPTVRLKVQRTVPDRAEEIRTKTTPNVPRRARGPQVKEQLLHKIFRARNRAYIARGESAQWRVVRIEDLTKRGLIPPPHTRHQRRIARGLRGITVGG